MGMFDYITYKDERYQTRDTPNQSLENYTIREDDTLWVEEYDSEWIDDEGLFGGSIKQSNHRWAPCSDFDGNIRFYRNLDKEYKHWLEYTALFMDGKMLKIKEKVE